MRKFEIMTDSTANLPKMMIDVYGIHVLSMRIIVEGEEYPIYNKEEGVSLQQFYDMMREKKDMSTVTITVDQAYKETKEILLRGRDILYIGFSSALSESFDSVCQAFSELQKEFPDRKLYAVDSLAAALGEGLFVKYVVEMREEGKEIDEVYHWALQNRLYFCHEFTVEDLFYLKRGGRISSTMALLGSTLSIRPILYVDDKGRLVNLGAARGRRSSLDNLVDQMKKYAIAPENQTIYINHGDCLEDAEYVADRIRAEMGVKDIMIQVLDPVIGVHAGPGTVAVFYYGEHRRKRIAGDFHTHIFIVNPYSGGQTFTDELRKQLDEIEGLNYYIFTTRYPGHEKELVKQILNMFEGEKLRFYCCGGSGTMRNIMNGFDDISDVEIAFYPCGLTNDFLKVFGEDQVRFKDIKELVYGEVIDVDYIRTNHGICLNTFSTGLDSVMQKQQENYYLLYLFGRNLPYSMSLIESIFKSKPHEIELSIDGEVSAGKYTELVFGNGFVLGGNLFLDNDTDVQDGTGCYCAVQMESKLGLLSYSRNIKKKRFDKMTDYLFRGPWHHVLLRRRDGKPLDVNQDGEIVRNVVEWELELVQKGLHLVVPKGVTL